MSAKPATVVSLGARGHISRGLDGGTSCSVREFALLSDRREVTLLEGRGWTSSARPSEIFLTDAVRNVLTAVLPDDAEETGDEHEWREFAGRLRDAGLTVTVAELRTLPYEVTLGVPAVMAEWPAK